jgi:hypothetical protein
VKRRTLVALGLATPAVIGRAWSPAVAVGARQGDEVNSGGIGLSRADWDELHGTGEVGQTLVTYEDGRYAIGFRDDAVSFLELGWEDQGGTDPDEARATVADILPSDALAVETFVAPPTTAGPIGMTIDRYQSDALLDAFSTTGNAPTGSIIVMYQETSATGQPEPAVSRATITIGVGVA